MWKKKSSYTSIPLLVLIGEGVWIYVREEERGRREKGEEGEEKGKEEGRGEGREGK